MESTAGLNSSVTHTELIAVLTAVTADQPRVMTIRSGDALPSGPFEMGHRTLQSGLRAWVEDQTSHPVGYLEQLYTFADKGRDKDNPERHTISISYLGLVREQAAPGSTGPSWHGWYAYLPWEDWRDGPPAIYAQLLDLLQDWARQDRARQEERLRRISFAYGTGDNGWNEDLVLQRYELLYEAQLIAEAHPASGSNFGRAMFADHRRILATAIARLRAKIKYRPVMFELMPMTFTLLQLQRTVEALSGLTLHKQNFRRLIEQQNLVEETGDSQAETGGRPAKLFRYQHSVLEERALAGSRLPLSRN